MSRNLDPAAGAGPQCLMQMLAIAGPSGRESAVARFIEKRLRRAGVPRSAITRDAAHRRSPFGGECGNLIVRLAGRGAPSRQPRRLLMAHMDTVPLAAGARPVIRGRRIVSAAAGTALGGDDRTGSAAILVALEHILRHRLPHPPLTFLWTVQEEVGLCGSRYVDARKLGRPAMAFNFDGRDPSSVTIGATGAYRMTIEINGLAAHAGLHPERGVSAIALAAVAMADLHERGWHGLIERGGERGTSNVGVIQGGHATNVVTDRLTLRAEARAHDRRLRQQIVREYRRAFAAAARKVRSASGRCGRVKFDVTHDYESFRLAADEPCVVEARRAIESLGLTPACNIANGGLDANWMNGHRIPTVTLNCGQHEIHTAREFVDLREFDLGCRLAVRVAVG